MSSEAVIEYLTEKAWELYTRDPLPTRADFRKYIEDIIEHPDGCLTGIDMFSRVYSEDGNSRYDIYESVLTHILPNYCDSTDISPDLERFNLGGIDDEPCFCGRCLEKVKMKRRLFNLRDNSLPLHVSKLYLDPHTSSISYFEDEKEPHILTHDEILKNYMVSLHPDGLEADEIACIEIIFKRYDHITLIFIDEHETNPDIFHTFSNVFMNVMNKRRYKKSYM